jgi:tetratricopeptide (TPR) repeat protein
MLFSTPVRAEPVEALIKSGDACDSKLQAAEALKYYLPAEKMSPHDGHLLASIARQYRHLMSDASSSEQKLKLGHIALDYAQRAAAVAPRDSEAQLAPGITYGKMLPLESKGEQIAASRHIKDSAEKAIKLNPENDLAWHVLGRWYRVLADVGSVTRALAGMIYGELPPATNDDALKCFKKAIALNPHRLMHYVELGHTYKQMGQDAEARKCIQKGLAMANTEKDDPETKHVGRELLAQLR